MKDRIVVELEKVEKDHGVEIIYACESGSRAWGFPSSKSDYDVRFIYIRPKDWYLSISEKTDVLETTPDDPLDMNGWDLRKALQLLRKSNSPLLEWLSSPIVYRCTEQAIAPLLSLSKKAFLPESSCRHYLAMAKNCMGKFGADECVKIKHYLYTLRTLLCAKWIVNQMEQPPMRIQDLLPELLPEKALHDYVEQLIEKRSGESETALIKRNAGFETFLDSELSSLDACVPLNPAKVPVEEFDLVFRKIIG